MDFHHQGVSPSSSATSDHRHHSNGHSSDPMHSWWDSISKARSRIHLLLSLPPSSAAVEDPLSSLADTDRPARSLLLSLRRNVLPLLRSRPAAADPLCHWLYYTFLSSDAGLRLAVVSYLPHVSSVYLRRVHHPTPDIPLCLSGFEAVLLAVCSSEIKAGNGKPVAVSVADLS